ncbi:MAG: hypothetical protein WBB74_06405 [Gaiellaceae bacterium]
MPALVLALALAQPAKADDPRNHADLTKSVGTAHVLVHYTTATGNPDAVTAQQAAAAAKTLESVWRLETGWGFPPPASDQGLGGDDRLDVYVAVAPQHRSFVAPDAANWRVSGFMDLDPADVKDTTSARRYRGTMAHEFFHTIQLQWTSPEAQYAPYLLEATAEWAGHRVSPAYWGAGPLFAYAPEASLDCPQTVCGSAGDGSRGYGQWPFFEYLSERYGAKVIREIFERDALLGWQDVSGRHVWQGRSHVLEAIDSVLEDHGTSLTRLWSQYAAFNLDPGRYTLPILRRLRLWSKPAHLLLVPAAARTYNPVVLKVDHLASTYLSLMTVNCDVTAPAVASTLHVRVTLPWGSTAVPALRITFSKQKPVIRTLKVAGGVASIDVPGWRACMTARLAVPNPSTTDDGVQYTVSVSVTAGTDARPPKVLALPATGKAGRHIPLRFQVFDDSGYASVSIRIYQGTHLLGGDQSSMGKILASVSSYEGFAPSAPGAYRFCVRAKDLAGNVSRFSCAPIRVTP